MSKGGEEQLLLRSGKIIPKLSENGHLENDDKLMTEENDKKSVDSRATTRRSTRRLILRAELEAMKELSVIEEKEIELEKKRLERRKERIRLELECKKSELGDELGSDVGSLASSSVRKNEYVQEWVETSGEPVEETNETSKECTSNKIDFLERLVTRQSINKDLPPFSGNPVEWPNFISQFRETTELCKFSNRENAGRLQKALRGKARDAVAALLNFPDEVDRIMKVLEKRFGKIEDILDQVFAQVKNTRPIRDDNLDNIMELSNCLQSTVVILKNLNCKEYLINPQIIRELVDKLPLSLKLQWGKYISNLKTTVISIEHFGNWLEEFIEEFGYIHSSLDKRDKRQKHIFTIKTNEKKPISCIVCKKDHYLANCDDFKKMSSEDRWKVTTGNRLCFSCLIPKHQTSRCNKKMMCAVNNCQKYHHKLLHNEKLSSETININETICHATQDIYDKRSVMLKVVPVILEGPGGKIETYALCDEGSTITVIEESVADYLQCTGEKEEFTMRWTNGTTKTEEDSRRISIQISGKHVGKSFILKNVRTFRDLMLPIQTIDVEQLKRDYKFLEDFEIDSRYAKPTILIGQDNWSLIIGREVIYDTFDGPAISRTQLGWILHGTLPIKHRVDDFSFHIYTENSSIDQNLHNLIKEYFSIEWNGIYPEKYERKYTEDKTEKEKLDKDIKRNEDNKWEVGLIWKSEEISLPESRRNALKRLKYIEKKMDGDATFSESYSNAVESFIEKGYARKLSSEESMLETNKTWYLPHFAVYNPNKPGKLRLVFDAAAKCNGISLNDNLLIGPDYFNNLTEILMKFREKRVAFSADIKEMFLQVKIKKDDRHAQRFLWRGRERNKDAEVYEMTSMIFGAKCSPSLAQAVKNKNALEYKNQYSEAVTAIVERHYMDDYLDSEEDEEGALKKIKEVIEIHRNGGFQICNWICSSREVLAQIPEDLRTNSTKNIMEYNDLPTERVLGMWWDSQNDTFKFEFQMNKINSKILSGQKIPTKREVLRISMLIFDPLGFIIHIMIQVRILLQDIWRQGIAWDEEISGNIVESWQKWLKSTEAIRSMEIPRFYFHSAVSSAQLHIFCDAGDKAYGAVAYFRYLIGEKINVTFVTAKARVAPLKSMSIPRLELMAAVIGVGLSKIIKHCHRISVEKTYFWSDSKTVILWLRSDSRNVKKFISLRIEDILDHSNREEWKWVDTKNNVADYLTKIRKPNNEIWCGGPEFLKKNESYWPIEDFGDEECLEEQKQKHAFVGLLTEFNVLPKLERFSKFTKLIRTTAWILRFIKNCKISIGKLEENKNMHELYPEEIWEAEKIWLKEIQQEMFGKDLNNMRHTEIKKDSRIYKLSPFLDDDHILRMKGRLKHAPDLKNEQKIPIILDDKHRFTEMLIDYYHQKFGHTGVETVINEIRSKYWITHIRSAVKKRFRSCVFCRNMRSKPSVPEMGELPSARVTGFIRPFTNCGVDYFGPMTVKIGRRHEKRYGVLFTCMATRAIHLELAHSLDTDSAIMAIKRMISRRGCPANMYSDNATNFRGSDNEIKKSVENFAHDKIIEELTMKGIKWHFLPPVSPNFGGAWERLIKTVKMSLKIILKESVPKEETLRTLLCEVEHTVNSRPLTYVPTDSTDQECLTPNHFLIGSSSGTPVLEMKAFNARKQWQLVQKMADNFWNRWLKEYLPILNRRSKWFDNSEELQVDDVVVIVDSNNPRNCWPKGKIVDRHPGKDGKVRVVDVKTAAGVFRRPVNKLCKIAVADPETPTKNNDE